MVPFITTLATYSVARGLGLMFTNQQMLFLDNVVMKFSGAKLFGIPLIVYIFLIVVLLGHFILTRTQYGRQLFACGNNLAGANKLGINGTKLPGFLGESGSHTHHGTSVRRPVCRGLL